MRHTLLLLLLALLLGCSGGTDDDEPADGLAGDWALVMGTGQSFMRLEQDGAAISGESCEAEGMDCYPLQEGKVAGFELTFFYSFLEAGSNHRVDGRFTVGDVGTTLTGELVSSKCDCELPHTYEKQSP